MSLCLCLSAGSGCAREAGPDYCPAVEVGGLVISELRGDQATQDSFGHYVEVYNASASTVDLQGMRVRLRSTSGDALTFFVRDDLSLAPGAYAVVAPGDPEEPQSFVDYAIGWDISGGSLAESEDEDDSYPLDLMRYRSAFVEILACGELIDQVFYDVDALPAAGTLACGNADSPPSADANDLDSAGCWCVDDQEADPDQPLFGVGLPGSPGGPNRCL